MRRPSQYIGVAILLTLLVGCATTRGVVDLPAIDSWQARKDTLGQLRTWEFTGRVAVKTGDEGFNARFKWTQDADSYRATVSGPLGIGTVLIEGDGRGAILTLWRYGWTIPVRSLRYWALGIPDPAVPGTTELDDQDRLQRLEQGGWSVQISRYAEGGGQQMPRILTVTNPDTRVRMVIDRWLFFKN